MEISYSSRWKLLGIRSALTLKLSGEQRLVDANRLERLVRWRFGFHAMCSMSLGMRTQKCMRSSYTEKLGPEKDGSANAPTGIATASGQPSSV